MGTVLVSVLGYDFQPEMSNLRTVARLYSPPTFLLRFLEKQTMMDFKFLLNQLFRTVDSFLSRDCENQRSVLLFSILSYEVVSSDVTFYLFAHSKNRGNAAQLSLPGLLSLCCLPPSSAAKEGF
jgi:hypothetical protein